jgi:hypothetical protein
MNEQVESIELMRQPDGTSKRIVNYPIEANLSRG